MKLFYFELEFEGKLFDTKVVAAQSGWDAWLRFRDMMADKWDAEMTEMSIGNWKQVAYCEAEPVTHRLHHNCPALLLTKNDQIG